MSHATAAVTMCGVGVPYVPEFSTMESLRVHEERCEECQRLRKQRCMPLVRIEVTPR